MNRNRYFHILPLLALVLCLAMLSSCRHERFVSHGVRYEMADGGVRVLPRLVGHYKGELNLPDSVSHRGGRYAVVGIANGAFEGCTGLQSLVIPATVANLDNDVLKGCTGLRALHLRHEVPPVADSTLLADVPVNSCNLYVPLLSAAAYSADVVWGQFTIFEEGEIEWGAQPAQHVKPVESDDHGE